MKDIKIDIPLEYHKKDDKLFDWNMIRVKRYYDGISNNKIKHKFQNNIARGKDLHHNDYPKKKMLLLKI